MSGNPFCHVCKKYFNSIEQLTVHEKGNLHLSKLKTLEENSTTAAKAQTDMSSVGSSHFNPDFVTDAKKISVQQTLYSPHAINQGTNDFLSHGSLNDISRADTTKGESPAKSQFVDGLGQDYVFDEATKRGKCYICDVDLTSKPLAHQHLFGKGHEKKKRQLLQSPISRTAEVQTAVAGNTELPQYLGRNSPSPKSNVGNVQGSYSNILMCKLCNAPFSSEFNMMQHFAGTRHKKELQKLERSQNVSVSAREDVYDNDLEHTKKMEIFQSGVCSANDNISRSKNGLGTTSDQRDVQGKSGLDFYSTGKDQIISQASVKTINNETDTQQFHRSLSYNLSEYNDKVTQFKEKQMILPVPNPQQPTSPTMTSIFDNNQQPSVLIDSSRPEPCSIGLNQAAQVNNQVTQASPNYNKTISHLNTALPVTSTPICTDENTTVKTSFTNIPSSNSSPLIINGGEREYEFDGTKGSCKACNVELTSLKQAQQHLNGQQHRKKSERWGGLPLPHCLENSISSNHNKIEKGTSFGSKDKNTDQSSGLDHSQEYYHFDGNKGYCRACTTELTSVLQASQHIQGKPHRRNVLRKMTAEKGIHYPLHCEICQKSFTGQESALEHFISDNHRRNEALFKGDSQVLEVFEGGKKLRNKGVIWYFCDICRKVLNTLEQLNIHRRSHSLSEIESPRGSPRHIFASGNVTENSGVFEGEELQQYGKHFPHSRQNSHSSYLDSPVSSEQIKELLTYGKNPVVNAKFSSPRADVFDPICLTQEQVIAETGAFVPGFVEGNRLIKGRGDFSDQTSSNYNQSEINTQSNFLTRAGDFIRFSSPSYQISPDDNINSSGFRSSIEQHNKNSGIGLHTTKENVDHGCSVKTSREIKEKRNSTDELPRADGEESSESGEYNNQENNSIFGNITVGGKSPTVRSGAKDRGFKNVVNLDQAEKEESSDDEDENDHGNTFMNIQGEERQPMTKTPEQPSNLHPSPEVRLGSRNKYYCELCKKQMNAKKSFKEHLEGKLHQWNLSSCKVPVQLRNPIEKSCIVRREDFQMAQRAFDITKNFPRRYQVNLMEKAMTSDCVVYLPTGTGKTMVSVLTIGLMLEKNPKRPVIFLVDKVLLVIQQARYIKTEFEGKKFKRNSLQRSANDDDNVEIVERELTLAFVCGGLLCTNNLPIWQHDIIVTTVDYCINMLNSGSILWEDFSLAVLDEVHHCVKKHPYRRLIQEYHLRIEDPQRPKILGLTASPAGKSTEEATYLMLKALLQELGGAKIAFVGEDYLPELKSYQSNPYLHPICVPLTDKEQHFQAQCIKYFLQCYIKLAPLSSTLKSCKDAPCSYFYDVLKHPMEETLQRLTDSLLKDAAPLSEILPFILQAQCVRDAEEIERNSYESLRSHTFKVLLHIADIPTGLDFDELKADFKESETNHILNDMKILGLPCETFYKQILTFEQEEGDGETAMIGKLIQILQDPSYINLSKKDSMALVLVRQRKNAKSLSKSLKRKAFVQNNSIRVACLVGHGKGTQDGGMAVKDQKKVLDNQRKYNILVATSIAEEGVDINTVELVVSMNPPSNVTALIQMRGRARKKGSYFVILCSSQEEMRKLEELQQHEKNMMEAAKRCLNDQ